MSLFITSLNSGSNGNCYYIGNGREAILVDAGISCRETEKRMSRLELSMDKVKAIFVSHEHTDHICGVPQLAKKYGLPVYSTPATLRRCPFHLQERQVKHFRANDPVGIGGLTVTAFPKLHDAAEPHSFVVTSENVTVGIFTDIGAPCQNLAHHFRRCHAAFLEANYDEELLDKGLYPIHLKNRIRGGEGHLSNRQALAFFRAQKPASLSHLILSHLSKENNRPELVQELFAPYAAGVKIVVASRFEETPVYTVTGSLQPATGRNRKSTTVKNRPVQLSLFDPIP